MRQAIGTRLGAWGVLATLAALGGCARDSGSGGVVGPAQSIVEGARVSGTLWESVEATRPNGETIQRSLAPAPFRVAVQGGVAHLDSGGSVATSRALPTPRRVLAYTDSAGHRHELVVTAAGGRGPVGRVEQFRDGEPVLTADFDWEVRPGGWVLKDRTLTVYQHGAPVLRHRRSVGAPEIAAATDATQILGAARGLLAGAFTPTALQAQSLSCLDKWIAYGLASSVLAIAVVVFIEAPSPVTYVAVVAAIAAWDKALDALIQCEFPDRVTPEV